MGCAALFTEDAELRSPYAAPACGRGAIELLHREWTKEPGSEGKRLLVQEAGSSGDLAWCLAAFSEGAATGDGTSLNVFERQRDGRWLIRMCSLNAEPIDQLPAENNS